MEYDARTATLSPFIEPTEQVKNSWCYSGYRVNIRNPYVAQLRERYRRKHNLPVGMPWSDDERLGFEVQVIPLLEKRFDVTAPPPDIPIKIRDKLPIPLLRKIYNVQGLECIEALLEQAIKK